MITQKDIAAVCGVSTTTVSRALADHSDIGEETKQRVRSAAGKLGYTGEKPVRKRPRSGRVGLLATSEAETFFHAGIIMDIRYALMERGYDLVLMSPSSPSTKAGADGLSGGRTERPAGADGLSGERTERPAGADGLSGGRTERPAGADGLSGERTERPAGADGLSGGRTEGPKKRGSREAGRPGYLARARILDLEGIFLFSSVPENELFRIRANDDLRGLILGEIPVVGIDCRYGSCPCVIPDYGAGVERLLSHLAELGHSRIAFVYGQSGEKAAEMRRAVTRAAHAFHLEDPEQFSRCVKVESPQEASEATLSILRGSRWIRPTCFLYGDDFLADGGQAAIRSQGLRIPEDVSIASMSFSDRGEMWDQEKTVWRVRPMEVAEAAVETMLLETGMRRDWSGQVRKVPGHMKFGETVADISWEDTSTGRCWL